jgi:hypothetical protein
MIASGNELPCSRWSHLSPEETLATRQFIAGRRKRGPYREFPGAINIDSGLAFQQADCCHHWLGVVFGLAHLGLFDIIGAIDQCDMRKCLWIIPQGDIIA